jgi:hypothetical protein
MTYGHVGEFAELYALGALDERERAAVETHLVACEPCTRLVGAAESHVALIASLEPRREAPPALDRRVHSTLYAQRIAWRFPAAVAAALVVGLAPSLYLWGQERAMHRAMFATDSAMARLASAPHRTASFGASAGGPAGQVMYAPDGSWYVVVIRNATKALDVVWMHDGQRSMLGRAMPVGDVSALYLPKSHRMDTLALMDGDRVVAQATLTWQKTAPVRRGGRSG